MWIVEMGQIGRAPGEERTRTLKRSEEASRGAAEFVAKQFLLERGVSDADAASIVAMAGNTWCDDFPTLSTVRIYEG
ncbi:hypothetical protein AN480_27140 (plasmid) [Mycobacterium intracellulare subsp. chimaera]|uniref:Uncharacterized protein n=1 Tax=Mycobacterium intracellulare subsp. chimaera TaxID=222805 RepID=A0ABT7P3E1_MYCIT|nr:hypothetical protein [Mycobacterium intracellulare]AOS94772.1 hypothetical protein AN480_27140 [Mycobacterium intracellulare subsp. chimaera]MDM3927815.1 hypothetical protein [Mycobacterium intracellulare subsp. chimaera]